MSDQKTFKISLGINERLQIHAFLPAQGDYFELTIKEDIEKKVNLSQEDLKEFEMIATPTGSGTVEWNWNESKEKNVEYEFTTLEVELIQKNIKSAEKEKKLISGQKSLYEKFVKNLN